MFKDLFKTEIKTIRGAKFIFKEYGSDKYIDQMEEAPEEKLSGKELQKHNIKFSATVVALSLTETSGKPVDEIIEEFKTLPSAVQDELFQIAAQLNGLTYLLKKIEGNLSPDDDSPES